MPPRVVKKNAETTAQKKTPAKVPSKYPKTRAKPVSSIAPKAEPDDVKTEEVKPSPTVETPKAEEKAIETFQDLKKPSVKVEPEKEISVEDANVEDKESIKDADKPSTEGSEEGVKRIDLENKEIDVVMHAAQDNKEQQNEPGESNVVIDEQSHGNEAAEGAGCREEGLEGDGGDEQHDVETHAVMHEAQDIECKDKEHHDEPDENNVVSGEQSHGDEVSEGAECREEGVEGDGVDEQHNVEMPAMVTLKATLRKPKQKGRSVQDGFHAGYGGTFGTAYYWRPPGPAYVRSESRRNYREDDAYLDRPARPSAKSFTRDYYGYHESMPPRKPPYSHRMKGMSAKSGSKRPYSAVDDDLPYPGRHSRSRLDYYDAGAADSRYGGVSRLGQDPQLGYGAGSRASLGYGAGSRGGGIYSSEYLPSGNDVEGGPYPSVLTQKATGVYGHGSGSASYY